MSSDKVKRKSNGRAKPSLQKEIENISRRPRASYYGRFIDIDRAEAYPLDAHAHMSGISVFHLRYEVDKAARVAVTRAKFELIRLPEAIRKAKLYQNYLEKSLHLLQGLQTDDIALDCAELSQAYADNDAAFNGITSHLVQISEHVRSLSDWFVSLETNFNINKHPPTRSDPLARHYITTLRERFLRNDDHSNPYKRCINSRYGAFVNLLADGWRSLCFERTIEDLEGFLGQKNEFIARNPSEFDAAKFPSKLGVIRANIGAACSLSADAQADT